MSKPLRDLTGQKFGSWTVTSRAEKPFNTTQTGAYWNCECECGSKAVKRGASIVHRGGSCGCKKSEIAAKNMRKMQLERHGTIDDRFMSRFIIDAKTGCWDWISHKDKDGYGLLPVNGPAIRAHRFSYEKYNGKIPDGMIICHKCDNPSCVNPLHLFAGTVKDNCDDMIAKERDAIIGERNNKAKLTNDDVIYILSSYMPINELAKKFNVHKSTIRRIKNNDAWRNIKHV